MSKDFFVMCNHPSPDVGVIPMVEGDDNERIALFETEEEAVAAASEHPFAQAYGWEVFELGYGVTSG